jgi:hypothetical protein
MSESSFLNVDSCFSDVEDTAIMHECVHDNVKMICNSSIDADDVVVCSPEE